MKIFVHDTHKYAALAEANICFLFILTTYKLEMCFYGFNPD